MLDQFSVSTILRLDDERRYAQAVRRAERRSVIAAKRKHALLPARPATTVATVECQAPGC